MMSSTGFFSRLRRLGSLAAIVLLLAPAADAGAQTPAPEETPARSAPPAEPADPAPPAQPDMPDQTMPEDRRSDDFFRRSQPAVRIGQDVVIRAGEVARDVVVISGSAQIDGYVEGDVVVILGSVTLGPQAVVERDLVVVSGGVTIAPGAVVEHDLVVVGGAPDIPPDFSPGGEYVVVAPQMFGLDLRPAVPWVTRGLLWGRPIVPALAWNWWFVGVCLFVYLGVSLLLSGPVRAGLAILAQKPLTAFLTGLLVLLLIGPVSVILSVSIIGIPIVPLLFVALLVAAVVGKVSVLHWIGDRVVAPDADNRWHWVRSFLLGAVIVTVAYVIPVLGLTAWALFGVLAVGAASLAFIAAWRRESPAPVRPPAPPPPPPPPPPPSYTPPGQGAPAGFAGPAPPFDHAPSAMSQADVAPGAGSASYAVPPPVPPAAAPAVADLRTFPYATFLERIAAFALDLIVVIIAFRVLGIRGPDDEGRFFLLLIAYHVGFWAWKQTTVGGIICNLRIVRTDGGRLSVADALVRGLSGILSVVVVGLGMLWILKDSERQSWHDKIAGTYVVKVPKGTPLQ